MSTDLLNKGVNKLGDRLVLESKEHGLNMLMFKLVAGFCAILVQLYKLESIIFPWPVK